MACVDIRLLRLAVGHTRPVRQRSAACFRAQVGKGSIVDLNTAAEKDLLTLPHMTPAIVKGLIEKRPFASIVEAEHLPDRAVPHRRATGTELLRQGLRPREPEYRHAGRDPAHPGRRQSHGCASSRSIDHGRAWAQFDKEISKYVGQPETDRLKQYVFIPVNLNTATDEDILSIPGAGPRMVREFKEYRPWKTKEQFEKEIGKYVGAKETARLWRYVVIP